MQVTNVRVSFLREKQPAQYEKAAPAVEFVATLDQGDDHVSTARALMTDAATIVYAGIGYDVPERVAAALANGKAPAELSVATKTTGDAPAAPETPGQVPEDKPKAKGRPVGSKNTAPKKETKATERKRLAKRATEIQDAEMQAERKRLAAEAALAAANFAVSDAAAGQPEDDDAVPGDEPTPNISTGGERVDPNDADGIPGDDDAVPGDEEFTPTSLHDMMTDLIRTPPRRLTILNAKKVLAHFKVARAGDLTQEQALEGRTMVEQMVAEFDAEQAG